MDWGLRVGHSGPMPSAGRGRLRLSGLPGRVWSSKGLDCPAFCGHVSVLSSVEMFWCCRRFRELSDVWRLAGMVDVLIWCSGCVQMFGGRESAPEVERT